MNHIKNSPRTAQPAIGSPVIDLRLSDPNQVAKVSQWDVDFRQIEPGPMETQIHIRPGRLLNLLEIRMSRGVHQNGLSPPDCLTLGVPLACHLSEWRGRSVDGQPLISFGTSAEFEGVSKAGFWGLTFSIPILAAQAAADRMGIPTPDQVSDVNAVPAPRVGDSLLTMARMILTRPDAPMDLAKEEEIVTALFLAATEHTRHDDRSTPRSRAQSIARAIDYMNHAADDNVPVSQICEAAGVSWRTLDRGFKEKFGIGPKAYYARLRLTRVRTELIACGPDILISDVANRWGFWHMGQFARDYRFMFEELPSETVCHTQARPTRRACEPVRE